MDIRKINEELKEILKEDDITSGTMSRTGHEWKTEKVDEKEIEILGVTLKYNIMNFTVPEADPNDPYEEDEIEFELQNKEALKELEDIINSKIKEGLGDIKPGTRTHIGIISQGLLK